MSIALIVKSLVRFLLSDPVDQLEASMGMLNQHIIFTVLDLLQLIIQRGDLDSSLLQKVQTSLLSRLLLCVSNQQLDLQNKLLHTLHATLQNQANLHKRRDSTEAHIAASSSTTQHSGSDLLACVLIKGVRQAVNSAVIHYWVDFLFMAVNQLRRQLTTVILPLLSSLIEHLSAYLDDLQQIYAADAKGKGKALANEADYIALLGALERLVLLATEEQRASLLANASSSTTDLKSAPSEVSTGFLGYVSGVLGNADATTTHEDTAHVS